MPYEVVVKELERDTVGSSASLGFRGRRFKCGHFPSAVFVTIKVPEEIECEGQGPNCPPPPHTPGGEGEVCGGGEVATRHSIRSPVLSREGRRRGNQDGQ